VVFENRWLSAVEVVFCIMYDIRLTFMRILVYYMYMKTIAIALQKGDTGKTVLSVSLAAVFVGLGRADEWHRGADFVTCLFWVRGGLLLISGVACCVLGCLVWFFIPFAAGGVQPA
jgi:hypothetical protein